MFLLCAGSKLGADSHAEIVQVFDVIIIADEDRLSVMSTLNDLTGVAFKKSTLAY
jgi:hypothetical protein